MSLLLARLALPAGEQPAGRILDGYVMGTDDSEKSKVFPPESWEADRVVRYQIGPLTESFHRSVPSLKYLNWTIEEIERGYAVTRLPLNVESSNQYITQQAALMLLAADYTGGIALSTLFRETPIIGFHAQKTEYGAYLWGASATIKWLRPSTADLICKSSIPERDWDRIALSFERGEEINYKARIKMYSDDGKIAAVSDFQYWARSSLSLRATGRELLSTHHMLTHKLRTSARLIAGLRSWIKKPDCRAEPLDPFAHNAAGPQGIAMAKKFSVDTPQLADLVKARTSACDDALRQFAASHSKFVVVNIGCGYDARAWRLEGLGDVHFVELDLPVMLRDRAMALPSVDRSPYKVHRQAFDILQDDLAEKLQHCDAPHDVPKFFIWEGGSMYFTSKQVQHLLANVRNLMCDRSVIWLDYVSHAAVNDMTGEPEALAFMESMRMVGEPFVWGVEDLSFFTNIGLNFSAALSAANVLGSADPVMRHYSFVMCSANRAA